MIGKLRGTIDSVREGHAILDVNGVGYMVFAASSTLGQLDTMSGEVSLVIETHVREDHIHLYGFLTEADRSWFTLLTTVQGVGAKMALTIQSCFSSDELTTIIAAQDKTAITRAKGVGAKVGERIITELKNKVANMPAGSAADFGVKHSGGAAPKAAPKTPANNTRDEAVSALVNLGYNRVDAFSAVARAMNTEEDMKLDDAIRHGLKELAA